jgi:hypothetical protein
VNVDPELRPSSESAVRLVGQSTVPVDVDDPKGSAEPVDPNDPYDS